MFSGPFYRQTLYIIFLFPLPFSILSTITFFISDKISKLISRKKNNINLTIEDEDEDEDIITDYYNTQKTTRNILIITIATILAVITAIPTLQQLIPYYKEDYIIPPKNPTSLFEQINFNETDTEKLALQIADIYCHEDEEFIKNAPRVPNWLQIKGPHTNSYFYYSNALFTPASIDLTNYLHYYAVYFDCNNPKSYNEKSVNISIPCHFHEPNQKCDNQIQFYFKYYFKGTNRYNINAEFIANDIENIAGEIIDRKMFIKSIETTDNNTLNTFQTKDGFEISISKTSPRSSNPYTSIEVKKEIPLPCH